VVACDDEHRRPHREVYGRTAMMHDRGKSDSSVVPRKPPNNAGRPAAEVVEGSGLAKGNSPEGRDGRTQRRIHPSDGLERVRQAARKDKNQRFTALMHHVYDVNRLRAAYFALKRDAAAGIDGETWTHFDTLNHEWLVRFLEHRVADRRVARLIQKWLRAGVLEDGVRRQSEVGTVQGGSVSPLLANVYLHYVFDLWVHRWRRREARGDVIVVRFADDFVVGFEHRGDAERFLAELRDRFARFGLALHPDNTRLLEFGRFAGPNRRARGDGKPETFDFLGFTHACSQTRKGRFTVLRQTMRRRWQAKLHEVKTELRRRLHASIPAQGAYVRSVVVGHTRDYGVPRNGPRLSAFHAELVRLWRATLRRRSQTGFVSWQRMRRLTARWLPGPRICHPYPNQRLAFATQGRSRMR
jgi:RNA-directed DNA polymerase